jgi:hypothetical protein
VFIGKKPVLLDGYRLATPDPPPVSRPVGGLVKGRLARSITAAMVAAHRRV